MSSVRTRKRERCKQKKREKNMRNCIFYFFICEIWHTTKNKWVNKSWATTYAFSAFGLLLLLIFIISTGHGFLGSMSEMSIERNRRLNGDLEYVGNYELVRQQNCAVSNVQSTTRHNVFRCELCWLWFMRKCWASVCLCVCIDYRRVVRKANYINGQIMAPTLSPVQQMIIGF